MYQMEYKRLRDARDFSSNLNVMLCFVLSMVFVCLKSQVIVNNALGHNEPLKLNCLRKDGRFSMN